MTDYISRQTAMDAAEQIIDRDTSGENAVVNAMIAWNEYIKGLPSADVVEVVRCKDCKYWEETLNGKGYCKDIIGFGRWWKGNDYCSYGEREDG